MVADRIERDVLIHAPTVPLVVQSIEPPHRFAFRWAYPRGAQARPGNSLLVEFTLTPEGGGTRLRLVESGFAALELSEADTTRYEAEHNQGWDVHLSNLQAYATRQATSPKQR